MCVCRFFCLWENVKLFINLFERCVKCGLKGKIVEYFNQSNIQLQFELNNETFHQNIQRKIPNMAYLLRLLFVFTLCVFFFIFMACSAIGKQKIQSIYLFIEGSIFSMHYWTTQQIQSKKDEKWKRNAKYPHPFRVIASKNPYEEMQSYKPNRNRNPNQNHMWVKTLCDTYILTIAFD